MARFLGNDAESRTSLDTAGVRIYVVDDETQDADEALVVAVLPEGARDVRAELVAAPPTDDEAFTGMGAWHINDVDELHVVASGEGIMEFATPAGAVAVVVEAGDVVEIRRAEHRYRPLTEQAWVIRHGGAPGADMNAADTGRVATPWPAV